MSACGGPTHQPETAGSASRPRFHQPRARVDRPLPQGAVHPLEHLATSEEKEQVTSRGSRHTWSSLLAFWSKHVSVAVEPRSCRDHLALERTFLAYLRTSLMLANIGAVVAQLFSLQQSDSGFGYAAIGKPMASACFSGAIITTLVGAFRTWHYQDALVRGKALSGGFGLTAVGLSILAILCAFFGFLITIDIVKESKA